MNNDPTPALNEELSAEDQAVAELLSSHAPVPAVAFRGQLQRHLQALNPGYSHRPAHLWPTAVGFAAAGAFLMVLGIVVAGLL